MVYKRFAKCKNQNLNNIIFERQRKCSHWILFVRRNRCKVSRTAMEALRKKCFNFKGTVQWYFRPPVFFHQFNQPGPLTNGFIIFSILVKILLIYSNSPEYHNLGSHVLGDFLLSTGVWYPGKIDSPGHHTTGRLTRQGIIPCRVWLAGVSYPRRLTCRGIIPWGVRFWHLKFD